MLSQALCKSQCLWITNKIGSVYVIVQKTESGWWYVWCIFDTFQIVHHMTAMGLTILPSLLSTFSKRYALDSDGIDGWVPSNYLDVCSDEEQIELRELHRQKAEAEAAKQAELAAKGAYEFAPDHELDLVEDNDDEKGGASNRMKLELLKRANNFKARQEAKHKANDGDGKAQEEFDKLEQERLARKRQNAANNKYKNRKNTLIPSRVF